jgi:thiamine pyrophosphokinase
LVHKWLLSHQSCIKHTVRQPVLHQVACPQVAAVMTNRATRDQRCVIVVASGDDTAPAAATRLPSAADPPPADVDDLPAGAYVVAADSGLDHAAALGLRVDIVVGDFDSVRPETLAAAAEHGTAVDRHPAAKDETDLELALDVAAARNPARILVLGQSGGRLDHLSAGMLLLADERYAGSDVQARFGPALVTVVRDEARLGGRPGELVSLLPVHGPARGVRTDGLLYPLDDEDLPAGTTRGVSNELLGATAQVRLREGVLLAIQPEHGTPTA